MSMWMRKGVGVVAACGVAAGCALLSAPAAFAAEPPTLPTSVTDKITTDQLPVQISTGWEAVTGPAASVNGVRDLATSLGVGNVSLYTGDDESGRAILIFTGNDSTSPTSFSVDGATLRSVDDDTDETWYVYDDSGSPDAAVEAGTAKNIPPVDASLVPQHGLPTDPVHFTLSPDGSTQS